MELLQYDLSELSQSKEGIPHDELLMRSTPLINLQDNDDETFMRELHPVYVDPHMEDEMSHPQYMLLLEEKQAFYIFNEIAKSEGNQNLCLPFIFKLSV